MSFFYSKRDYQLAEIKRSEAELDAERAAEERKASEAAAHAPRADARHAEERLGAAEQAQHRNGTDRATEAEDTVGELKGYGYLALGRLPRDFLKRDFADSRGTTGLPGSESRADAIVKDLGR